MLGGVQPVLLDFLDQLQAIVKLHGLGEVAVRAELVAARDVFLAFVGVGAALKEEIQRLLAVAADEDAIALVTAPKSLEGDLHIGRVVLYQENIKR